MLSKMRYIGIFSAITGLFLVLVSFGAQYLNIADLSFLFTPGILLLCSGLVIAVNYSGVNLLQKMCKTKDFDSDEALWLCKKINLQNFFIYNHTRYPEKFLEVAIHHRNSKMVDILLQSGVNPNIGENVNFEFFELRHPEKSETKNREKLFILSDMLSYGANPNMVSITFKKDLFSCVYWSLFKDCSEKDFEYYKKFFVLLSLYGGKCEECIPKFTEKPDYENDWKYDLVLLSEKDENGFIGSIRDEYGHIIAYI